MGLLAILLFGLVQGITEFLPISSSGHLTLMQIFSEKIPESLSLNIAVHLGTLVTILVFYRRDILELIVGVFKKDKEALRSVGFIVAASIPTALLGLTVKKVFPFLLSNPGIVGVCFLVTGVILFSTRWVGPSKTQSGLTFQKALLIGVVQGIAVLPGLSRSGLTIVSSLWLGVEKEAAARFSFLISVPAILGAALLEAVSSEEILDWEAMTTGAIASFVVGLGAIYLVVWLTKKQRLGLFSYYLWAVGVFVLARLIFVGV